MVDEPPNLRGAVERLSDASATAFSAATDTSLHQLVEAVADEVRQVAAEGDQVPGWAMPSLPLAGSGSESPVPGSAVWIMFERGDPSRPVALGSCPV